MGLRLTALLCAAVAVCICAPAGAAPFGIRLGNEQLILDTPPGFSDSAGFSSPRLTDLAESLTEASNRVLVFALADADIRRFSSGDDLELRRYLIAVTPRATQRQRLNATEFAALLQDSGRDLAAPPPASTDFARYLQDQPPGQPHVLAVLRNDARMLSIMRGNMRPLQGAWREKPVLRLNTITLVLIGGRAFYVSAFSAYDGPADLAWIKTVTERWIEDLERLNR